jgi:hypothetical protein
MLFMLNEAAGSILDFGMWILDLRYSVYFIYGQSKAIPPI